MVATSVALLLVMQAPAAKAPETGAATPEQAVRTFIVAMTTKDGPMLRAVILPAEDSDALLQGQGIPRDAVEGFKAQIAGLPVHLLEAGEEIPLADGRKYKARAEDVAPDRAVALPKGASFPVQVRKVEGRWRIDAAPVIANIKGEAPKALDPARIKDKITIQFDQKIDIQFERKGDVISAPKIVAKPEGPAVHVEFTRLSVGLGLTTKNPFTKNLAFRALARHKGRTSYVETSILPVPAGLFGLELWQEPIEELVLFDFKLVDDKR